MQTISPSGSGSTRVTAARSRSP